VPTTSIGESVPIGSSRVRCGLACSVLRTLRERRQPLETKPTSGGDGRRLALARLREVAQRVPSDHRGPQALAGVLTAANRGGRAPYQHKRALSKTGIWHARPRQLSRLRNIASPGRGAVERQSRSSMDGWKVLTPGKRPDYSVLFVVRSCRMKETWIVLANASRAWIAGVCVQDPFRS
jgi:hypothetical protein